MEQKDILLLLDEETKRIEKVIFKAPEKLKALEYFILKLMTIVGDDYSYFEIVGMLENAKLEWKKIEDETNIIYNRQKTKKKK